MTREGPRGWTPAGSDKLSAPARLIRAVVYFALSAHASQLGLALLLSFALPLSPSQMLNYMLI
jgi:hypothetical protein